MGQTAGVGVRELSDGELVDRVRGGEREAYGLLYERHHAIAERVARSTLTNASDVDDVVSEVFSAVLAALERGNGPAGLFLPYLLSSVRNQCYRVNRRGSCEAVDRFGEVRALADQREGHHDTAAAVTEAAVVRVAFESLPENLQEVLWRTEIDEATPSDIANGGGATPTAVTTMALRARRALATAYLQQHLDPDDVEPPADCQATRASLAEYVRGGLGARRRRRIEHHLSSCEPCNEARQALGRVNRHLRSGPFWALPLGLSGPTSIGTKAQIVSWLWSSAGPVATAGAIAVAVVSPTVPSDPPWERRSQSAVVADAQTGSTLARNAAVGRSEPLDTGSPSVDMDDPSAVGRPDAAALDAMSGTMLPPVHDSSTPAPFAEPLPFDAGTGDAVASSLEPPSAVDGAGSPTDAPPVPGNSANLPSQTDEVVGQPDVPVEVNDSGNGHAGAPSGQQDNPFNGHAGVSPGRQDNPGNGHAGVPPGQLDNPGNGHAGVPPGQQDNPGNHRAGPPSGQQDNPGNGHAGAPPGLHDNPGNGHADGPPGQQDNPGNHREGHPPGHQEELSDEPMASSDALAG